MKQARKILSLVLALCLMFSLGAVAFASGESTEEPSDEATEQLVTLVVDGVEMDYEEGDEIPEGGVLVYTDLYEVNGYEQDYRTALYVNDGVVDSRSVTDAVVGGSYDDEGADGISITSQGDNFNGLIVEGGSYELTNSTISLTGLGRQDAQGFGSGVYATGTAQIHLDHVTIDNTGVTRSAMVVEGDAEVYVSYSTLSVSDGVPHDGYVGTVGNGEIFLVPWTLGLNGNIRAVNLFGNGHVTYYESLITSEKWGVLSFDDAFIESTNSVQINSTIAITGGLAVDLEEGPTEEQLESLDFYEDDYKDNIITTSDGQPAGYGTLVYGSMLGVFAGSTIYVPTFAAILANQGGTIVFTSSSEESLRGISDTITEAHSAFTVLNPDYEIYALEEVLAEEDYEAQNTVVYSDRIGIMTFDDSTASEDDSCKTIIINDGTEFYTGGATMLIKGYPANIYVDDATLVSGSNVILQLEDCDDSGMCEDEHVDYYVFAADYEELTANNEDTRERTRTLEELNDTELSTSMSDGDHLVTATFSNIDELVGDMYNSSGSNTAYNADAPILNMYVILDNIGTYSGAISASHGYHSQYTSTYINEDGQEIGVIASPDWWGEYADEDWFSENGWDETDVSWHYLLSNYTDVACESVDNGVIVQLTNGTTWDVTGESYLTMLIVGEDCTINGTMTVDGVETEIVPGTTYEGNILLLPA